MAADLSHDVVRTKVGRQQQRVDGVGCRIEAAAEHRAGTILCDTLERQADNDSFQVCRDVDQPRAGSAIGGKPVEPSRSAAGRQRSGMRDQK